MSVPVRLYRALLRACRRFDQAPQPRSIEPLVNSTVVLNHVDMNVLLGVKSATSCLRECFRKPKMAHDPVKALDDGFHCLRVLQLSEDLSNQNLVHESDTTETSNYDQISDDDEEDEDDLNADQDKSNWQKIAIFSGHPHIVHEPFELIDLLKEKNRTYARQDDLKVGNRIETQQLTLDLMSAIESDDALNVQSIVSDILDVSVHLIPRHLIASVVESCCSTLNSHLAFRLFDKLREQGITVSPRVLVPLLQYAEAYDDISTAVSTLRETIWTPASASPVAVECENDDPEDKKSLHAVMWISSNICDHNFVEMIFKFIIDRGIQPDGVTLLIMLRSICNKSKPDIPKAVELISLFETEWGIQPCSNVFNILLFSCYNSLAYNTHDAVKVLRQMQQRHIQPTKESYQALLLCAAKDERERIPNTAARLTPIMKSLEEAGFNIDDLIRDIANKLDARWRL